MRRHLLPVAFAATLLGSSALAQTASGDAVRGKPLYDNTPTASAKPGITANCVSCHGAVEGRRSTISANSGGAADSYADITFEMAMTRFASALQNQAMMRMYQALDAQQVYDIAAYLADTPKTNPPSETQLNFVAALNGNSAAQTVSLKHSNTSAENLLVKGVTLEGTGAGQFLLGNPAVSCLPGPTLTAAQSCAVTVTYVPTTSGSVSAELVFRMSQGSSGDFYRALPLSGNISGAQPPANDGGGGALGLGWLAALGAAVAALSRRRRG